MSSINIYASKQINLADLQTFLNNHPQDNIILNISNTKGIKSSDIDKLIALKGSEHLYIRIIGGYDEKRVKNYPKYIKMHTEDNIYSLWETRKILLEIENIEANINNNWDDLQVLMSLINQLKTKIIYHPFYETQASKDIRSLRGLISGKTVCAGYALILKELCDRNNIICQYVEGTVCMEEHQKGDLTHAWNIVKIQGNYIPIDLTFNASNVRSGKLLSLEDIGNVNEFVKYHIPGRYEQLQDYKSNLKSIDGSVLRNISQLVSLDMEYRNATVIRKRKNGTKFILTQVGQVIKNNEYVYKFVYQDLHNNKVGKPVILYTTTNVARIYELAKKKDKLLNQLQIVQRNGQKDEVEMIRKQLNGSDLVDTSVDYIDNLMFSIVNINDAIKRRDYFVGAINVQKNPSGRKYIENIYVDPEFGKGLSYQQKTYVRNDGSSFVLESSGFHKLSSDIKVYTYRVYEPSFKNDLLVQKYTIFTDEDILLDSRSAIPNVFLDAKRLARKSKESGGYLGYLSKDNVKTYNPQTNMFFKDGLHKINRLNASHFRNYYETATFSELKRLVQVYDFTNFGNHEVLEEKHTKRIIPDETLYLHTKFAYLWLKAAGMKWMKGESVHGFNYAFSPTSEEIFNYISKVITNSMIKDGNIDPITILYDVERNSRYKYAKDVVIGLFSSKAAVNIVNKVYRRQNPSAMREKVPTAYFDGGLYVYEDAYAKLTKHKKELLAAKEKMLAVSYNQNGEAEVKPMHR